MYFVHYYLSLFKLISETKKFKNVAFLVPHTDFFLFLLSPHAITSKVIFYLHLLQSIFFPILY